MGPEFDRERFPAKPVWVEEWNGLVFLNLSTEEPAQSVAQALAKVDFSRYELANTKVVADRVYELESNWKVAAENQEEPYHCHVNHPAMSRVMDPLGELGALDDVSGDDDAYSRDFLTYSDDLAAGMKEGAVNYTMDGQHVCKHPLGSAEAPANRNSGMSWFPNLNFHLSPDAGVTFSWLPVSARRSRLRSTWLVHADAREGVDYDADQVAEFFHVTNLEDQELCRIAQEGIRSTAYDHSGPYHPALEALVRGYMRTYLDHVAVAPGPRPAP
jgi:Rieske 2Fe-2S family protein